MSASNIKLIIFILLLGIVPTLSYSQKDSLSNYTIKFTAGWQINSISNNFISNISGYGGHMEASYSINTNWSVGVFVAWHTNNQYIPTKTYVNNSGEVTTAMYHGIYQVPFGALLRYKLPVSNKIFSPYAALKLGTNYSEQSIYLYLIELLNKNWGIYVSPEIGTYIFPFKRNRLVGLHIAAYYGYANNCFDFLTAGKANGLHNLGIRIGGGVSF